MFKKTQPVIMRKNQMTIVGLTGDGNLTGSVWEEAHSAYNRSPFERNDENGYEIRFYGDTYRPGRDIHVGFLAEPAEGFDAVTLPSSIWAVFDIVVADGYDSQNAAMDSWLIKNAEVYRQRKLDGLYYVLECYKPGGIAEIWIPVERL